MPLAQRQIDVTFTLGKAPQGQATFAGGGNSIALKGLRVSARIQKVGLPSFDTAVLQVYGLTLPQMNQLATLGTQGNIVGRNTVQVAAGDKRPFAQVFAGTIDQAWADFEGAPDVALNVIANGSLLGATVTTKPLSFPSGADAASVMSDIASRMGRVLENSGVTTKLPAGSYLWGSAIDIVKQVATMGNFEAADDAAAGTLAIWPKGKARKGSIPVISSETGLRGYPGYASYRLAFRTLFNPSQGIRVGGDIEMRSTVKPANGKWNVFSLEHNLQSQTPHGQWFSSITCLNFGQPAPTPPAQ